MKRIQKILFSMTLTGIMLLVFAFAIGYATFIENDFGTAAARVVIYEAKWFEALLLLLTINLIGIVVRKKLYKADKPGVLLFHLAFILIVAGGAITRYTGHEGVMKITEGGSSDQMISDETYFIVTAGNGDDSVVVEKEVLFTPVRKVRLSETFNRDGKDFRIKGLSFIPNAVETAVEDPQGAPLISLVTSAGHENMKEIILRSGDIKTISGVKVSFDNVEDTMAISIKASEGELTMISRDTIFHVDMMAGANDTILPGEPVILRLRNLYSQGSLRFVVKSYLGKGKIGLVPGEDRQSREAPDAFLAMITSGNETKEVVVYGGKGYTGAGATTTVNGQEMTLRYGSKITRLPFSLRLDDFQLERYPGSNSPSSFASEVTVLDETRHTAMPYRIFMNNILSYRGYRFYQSSYDRDEKGTVLSVNHDRSGTLVTYAGYALMTLGMFLSFFSKKSRFRHLARSITRIRESRLGQFTPLLLITVAMGCCLEASIAADAGASPSISPVSRKHAEQFGRILIQDRDGRIEPLNTLSSQILLKLTRQEKFLGLTPDQVFLGMMTDPTGWQAVPMIRVSNPQLKNQLGISGRYASFNDLVKPGTTGGYMIGEQVEKAYEKKPSERDRYDKDVIAVDERVNVAFMVYSGDFLRIFPLPGDSTRKWDTPERAEPHYAGKEAMFVGGIISMYTEAVVMAGRSGDWAQADEYLGFVQDFQQKYGAGLVPTRSRQSLELFYNNFNIFKRVSSLYGLVGFVLLVLNFIALLRPGMRMKTVSFIGAFLIIIGFVFHTGGLAIRWYISGHAPWSNGYESMIYIAWAASLAGLIFWKRSEMTLAVTALLSSLILAVAGMSWMDPQITNLVPVLKSYWLILHVAVITASYGFLGLGSLLGFFNLIIICLKTGSNHRRLNASVTELTHVIGMAIIAGLFLLTIGTFLGGVWANESWGRYWGWDPKETWALVTILVYASIVHMHLIPGFRGNYAMSLAALLGYGTVMMTYFGVNYYLSGMHSYAQGDPVPVPAFVYYTLAVILIVSLASYFKERRFAMPQPDAPAGS
jgi:cytochrome c-type biogenesis protein CcsB